MRVRSPQELGVLIRQQRQDQGLSQEALANRVGATRQWVRMLEQGKPRLELGLTLRALAALGLGVDIRNARSAGESPPSIPRTVSSRDVDIDAVIDAARGQRR